MTQDLDHLQPEIMDAMIALTGVALKKDLISLATPMFEAARRFRPASPNLEHFAGCFALRRGDLVGAVQHLSSAVDKLGAEAGAARSLLAMVMCAQGDRAWESHAQHVIDDAKDPQSVYLMKTMLGDADAVQPFQEGLAVEDGEMPDEAVQPDQQGSGSVPLIDDVTAEAATKGRTVFLRG